MRRHFTLVTTPVALALAMSAPANAADTRIAELQRPSTVRSYGGVQVFSDFDGSAYRLAILREAEVEHLPVAPSRAPFDADIGPDRSGRPQLIYTRCQTERVDDFGLNDNGGCDLVVFSLAGGGSERPVRGANTTDGNEFAPTLWRGRIAFARQLAGSDRPLVYTRQLGAPRSRPSTRLPSIRRRTTTRGVLELDLSGRWLAQRVFYSGRAEVRLVDTSDRSVRRLAHTGVGAGAQYFAGIGFAGDHLAWVSSWLVGGGRVTPGIYRYRLSTGELSRARFPRDVGGAVVALALLDADGAYVLDGDPSSDDGCGSIETSGVVRRCQLIRSEPLAFRPVGG